VKADPTQLEQVLMNLVVNARDAMPSGGRLTLETAQIDLDARYAQQHPGVERGSYVMLAVSDTGIGMDAATRARIFEPFFTTKPVGQGTGLGLSTVYGIVKQSGGHISVYSEPGRGTSFKVYLPSARTELEPLAEARDEDLHPKGRETVLLVEDEDDVREFAREALQEAGYTVLDAGLPEAAIRTAGEHAGPIHLMVTDVVMPHMNGRVLAGLLVKARPDIKVLFMSGYTDDAIVHHGVLEPETPFIQKPFTPGALLRQVRATLDRPVSF
jgi:two-component system cell cycle sensor histidine kinase/response regulator CckA